MPTIDKGRFRNAMGVRFLKGLFFETTLADKSSVVYTLKDRDHEGYPSLYRLYMELGDVTEYEFANLYLEGWEHWCLLCECNWFSKYLERWRKELELKIRAKALNRIISESKSDSKAAFQAAKFLVEKGWVDKAEKGRPSKEDVKQEASRLAEIHNTIENDLNRILAENNGG